MIRLKENIKEIATVIISIAVIILSGFVLFDDDTNEAYAEDTSRYKEALSKYVEFRSIDDIYPDYSEYGCTSIYEASDLLEENRNNSKSVGENLIKEYSNIITDDQKDEILGLQDKMSNAVTLKKYYEYESEFNSLKGELESKKIDVQNQTSITNYDLPSAGSVLTKSKGTNYFNGRTETWYSTRESGQTVTAYPIPGRWTGSDGIIRDKDGYICVAASDLAPYSIVQTSLGIGKVYDCGCRNGVTDIYTEW